MSCVYLFCSPRGGWVWGCGGVSEWVNTDGVWHTDLTWGSINEQSAYLAGCLYCGITVLRQYRNHWCVEQTLTSRVGQVKLFDSSFSLPSGLSIACTHFSALWSFPLFSSHGSAAVSICHLHFVDDCVCSCEYVCVWVLTLCLERSYMFIDGIEKYVSLNGAGVCFSHSVLPADISIAG